jgi:pimeloyl-ACP methyl ester carboxylesterase
MKKGDGHMSKHIRFVRVSALALGLIAVSPLLAAATPIACESLKDLRLSGTTLEIRKATVIAAGTMTSPPGAPPGSLVLPTHCRVDGQLESRIGSDGKPYAIGFAIALPGEWNGRFLFQGGGGLNGSINPPVGDRAAGETSALARGFAVVSTDSGHTGAGFDGSFLAEQQAALNFLYQANDKVTVVAKQIVAAHYGSAAHHSYFVGCSTGGREAMMMSQRFPEHFDGIVAGAPAMRTNYSNLALRWATTALNAVAPRDAKGKPQTQQALSDADRKLVVDGFVAACDALDGAKDGMVFATQSCHFDPAALVCKAGKTKDCLTAAKASAIKKGFAGPKDDKGRPVYPGFLYDTGIANSRGLPGLLVGPVIPEGGAPGVAMDVEAEAVVANDGRAMLGDTNAWTNLSGFTAHKGKLIFYHGVSDPWFSALETTRYFEQLSKDNGPTPIADWSRLFLVPGMGHCGGGERTLDRFDMVDAIVNWVEKDRAPDQVIATGISDPGVSRPLCPYPLHAHYTGKGDINSAASFSCQQ